MDTSAAVSTAWHGGGFLLSSLGIILINIILSGDNSVVIAMAVHTLPAEKRLRGLLLGTGLAVLLRVAFTWLASNLLQTPFLKLAGGILILLIAVKLLIEDTEVEGQGKHARTLWHAVWIILVADTTMSLDNVLAVAGVAHGNAMQLWLSLGLSIPLVVFSSTLLLRLMDRFPLILYLGAALLGKVGGEMIITDPVALNWPRLGNPALQYGWEAVCTIGVLAAAFWLRRRPMVVEATGDPPEA